jgi:hypothetical protein
MVIVVLLNVALICATPSDSITRFVFLPVAMFEPDGRWEVGDGRTAVSPAPRSRYFVTFFLPAIARRGPFLVRALVCVR